MLMVIFIIIMITINRDRINIFEINFGTLNILNLDLTTIFLRSPNVKIGDHN